MALEAVAAPPLDEATLIAACVRGDRVAERTLFQREYGRVNATVFRILGSTRDADDLVQETFIAVFRALPRFRGESKLSTWIYRITVNLLSQQRPDLANQSLDEVAPGDDRPRLQPGANDPAFGDMMLRDRLDKAILQLPVPYQVLVNGHYLKGMRYEDLAEALNLPMGTVKTHLHRAKRRLRQLLETEFR